MVDEEKRTNEALDASKKYNTVVEEANDYIEHFDILETITNVGNDEVFTPRKTCDMMLDSLPEEVWHNPLYKWLNPATKNGIFEREIALRLDKGLENVIPNKEERRKHILQNMIFSIGQTKFTSNVARRTLYYCSQANRKCDGLKAPDGHYVNGYSIGNGSWFDDEEGNIKTPMAEHEFVDSSGRRMPSTCKGDDRKKYKCKCCGIPGNSKYNDANQRENYAYEFIHINHLIIEKHLSNRFFGGNRKMKFDIIIGNPPYQLNVGVQQDNYAIPIYQKFVEQAISLNPRYLMMIIPAKWYSGGRNLDTFRANMLSDRRIKKIVDFPNPYDCFETVDNPGGICFFLWDSKYDGDCEFVTSIGGKKSSVKRKLNEFPFFIRDAKGLSIVKKVKKQNINKGKTLDEKVSPQTPFGIITSYKPLEKGVPCWFKQKVGVQYVKKEDVSDLYGHLNKFKVLIPEAPIAGQTDFTKDILLYYTGNTFIAAPGECCSQTYLVASSFDTRKEAEYFQSYLLTKVVRFLILQTVVSQHVARDRFIFVPDLGKYDHRYSDEELLDMFGLSQEDYAYIQTRVRNFGE